MIWFEDVEVIVPPDVQEGKQTAVNPPSSLAQQGLVILHGVCESHSIRDVGEGVLGFGLTIYTQTQNSILGQVHVLLLVAAFLLHFRVQNWGEITSLEQVLLVFLWLNQGHISVGRPSSWEDVKETRWTLKVFIKKMCHYVLILLCLLNAEKGFLEVVLILLLFRFALQGREITINTHQASDSSNIFICIESLNEFSETIVVILTFKLRFITRSSTNIQQDNKLRL